MGKSGGKGGKGKFGKKGGKGKGSSSSSKGKGKGGGSSGGSNGRPMPEFDDDWVDNGGGDDDTFTSPPGTPGLTPCMCNPSFCDCEEGQLATDYEFVLVSG